MKNKKNKSPRPGESDNTGSVTSGGKDDIQQVLVEHQSRIINEINTNINEKNKGSKDEN